MKDEPEATFTIYPSLDVNRLAQTWPPIVLLVRTAGVLLRKVKNHYSTLETHGQREWT